MRLWQSSLGCAIVAGGCQMSPPPEPTDRGNHTAVVHPGDATVSVVGTPFYLVFKSVVCVASVAIAAPVAGIAALSESRLALEVRRDLGDGVNQNCGPPYVLSPLPNGASGVGAGGIERAGSAAGATTGRSTRVASPAAGGPIELLPGSLPHMRVRAVK